MSGNAAIYARTCDNVYKLFICLRYVAKKRITWFSVASVIEAADAAVKATPIQLITINLAMAIGGKGWVSMTGEANSGRRTKKPAYIAPSPR